LVVVYAPFDSKIDTLVIGLVLAVLDVDIVTGTLSRGFEESGSRLHGSHKAFMSEMFLVFERLHLGEVPIIWAQNSSLTITILGNQVFHIPLDTFRIFKVMGPHFVD
jgi:hypothetical protein